MKARTGKDRSGPVRTCFACRTKALKYDLIRFVIRDGVFVQDTAYRLEGRGIYCCRAPRCREKMLKKGKKLARAIHPDGL